MRIELGFFLVGVFFLMGQPSFAEQDREAISDAIENFFEVEEINAKPTVPELGIDKTIGAKEKISPQEFFKLRRAKTTCRKYLDNYRKRDREQRAALDKAIAEKAPETELRAMARKYSKNRSNYLKKLTECGDCYVSEGKQAILPARLNNGEKQTWYIADGSCLIHSDDQAYIRKGFEKAKDWITNTESYPQRNKGVEHLLEFRGEGDAYPDFPNYHQYTYLAVKGEFTLIPGQDPNIMQVFTYFIKNKILPKDTTDELQVSFVKHPEIEGFTPPEEIYNINPIGQKKVVAKKNIEEIVDVQGMWYVNSDGWLRYYTAAVFKSDPGKFLGVYTAKRILQSTLVQVVEKTYEEVE